MDDSFLAIKDAALLSSHISMGKGSVSVSSFTILPNVISWLNYRKEKGIYFYCD